MPSTSYPLNILLYSTDGSTPAVSKVVTARNGTNSETTLGTTNGSGEVILNLADLDSDYTNGDVITIYSVDGDNTVYTTHTVDTSVGVFTATLTYVDVSTTGSTDLRYFTAAEFREFFCLTAYNSSSAPEGIKTAQIERIGIGVEASIDRITQSKFDYNSGSYYTATNEYHSTKELRQRNYYSKYGPIQTVSKFEVNSAEEGDTAVWTDLVSSSDYDDYWSYEATTGKFRISNSAYYTSLGDEMVRLTYLYGSTTVPDDVKRLAMLMTGRELAKGNLFALSIAGTEMEGSGGSINIVESMNKEIERLINNRMRLIAENV